MARTARDLLTRAMRVATIIGAGEPMDDDDAADALLSVNLMLDAWAADRLFAYAIQELQRPLTAGVGTVTIGLAGDIVAPVPVRIEYAFTRDAFSYDRGIDILPPQVFAQIGLKSLGQIFPTAMRYDVAPAVGTVTLWPLPPAGLTLRLGAWVPLNQIATLDDPISLPRGYEDAIVMSLAERLCPEYGKAASADLMRLAQRARAAIQQNNLPEPRLQVEFRGVHAGDYMSYAQFISGDY